MFDVAGTAQNLGGVPTDGPVYMARNRRSPAPEIGIVSDGLYFVIDTLTDTLTQNTDLDLPPASSIAVLDGYFILPGYGSKWFISGADDATQIDGLDFASAEASPDDIVRAIDFNRDLWLMGERTIEVWRSGATGDFPFARSAVIELGCLAPGSVAKLEEALVWVADDGTVRLSDGGYGGRRISTHAVERSITDEPDKAGMTSTSWVEDGHFFYVLNGTNFSWQFDLVAPQGAEWAERESYGLNRWRIATVVEFNGALIAGDYTNGKLYTMSDAYDDEAGTDLVCTTQTPPVHAWPDGLIFDALHLDVIPGAGLNSTATEDQDPAMLISWSNDGGQSWSAERSVKVGKQGQTQTRVKTTRLGMTRRNARTFRFRMSAKVSRGIMGASAEVERIAA